MSLVQFHKGTFYNISHPVSWLSPQLQNKGKNAKEIMLKTSATQNDVNFLKLFSALLFSCQIPDSFTPSASKIILMKQSKKVKSLLVFNCSQLIDMHPVMGFIVHCFFSGNLRMGGGSWPQYFHNSAYNPGHNHKGCSSLLCSTLFYSLLCSKQHKNHRQNNAKIIVFKWVLG